MIVQSPFSINLKDKMPLSVGQRSTPTPISWSLTIDSKMVVVTGSMSIGALIVQLINHLGELNL